MAWKAYNTVNGMIMGETSATGARPLDYQLDALGSVVGTIKANGTLENTFRYAGYGQQVNKTGAGSDPKFLWVGGWGYRHGYVRRRHYVTGFATWSSIDPIWPRQHAYSYVDGNPATLLDPLGLQGGVCWHNCCDKADAWFSARSSHCATGWEQCPPRDQVAEKCANLNSQDCERLKKILIDISQWCITMCSQTGGGGYDPNAKWDAAAYCCIDTNPLTGAAISRGCEVRCCKGRFGNWQSDPVLACATSCLLLHEANHLHECNTQPPVGSPPEPPYSECCAYRSQMLCLAEILRKKCGILELPSDVGKCLSLSTACAGRY